MKTPLERRSLRLSPVLLGVLGIALLTGMDGFVKELAGRYPTFQLTFLRFTSSAAIAGALFLLMRASPPDREALRGNIFRGMFFAASSVTFFFGLRTLPIAEVFAISYLAPVLVALLSIPVLGERPSRIAYLSIALGFAGALVTIGGMGGAEMSARHLLGAASMLGSSLAYAMSILFLRRLATRGPAITIALFQSAVPMIVLAVPAALTWSPLALADVGIFAIVGGLGVAGHLCLAAAYARAEASRIVTTEYTGFVWAALIGIFIFGEWPTFTTLLGAALVIGACLLLRTPGGLSLRQMLSPKRRRSPAEAP